MTIEQINDVDFTKLLKSFIATDKRSERITQQIFICCAQDLLASKSCKRLNMAYKTIENSIYCKQFLLAINCIAGNYAENSKGKFFKKEEILSFDKKNKIFSIMGDLPKLDKIYHFRSYQKGNSEDPRPLLTWEQYSNEIKNSLERKISKGLVREKDIQKFQELLNYLN